MYSGTEYIQGCVIDNDMKMHTFNPENTVYPNQSVSNDCQSQAAVIQALIDLDSSTNESCFPGMGVYVQQINAEMQQMQSKYEKKACNCAKSHCLKLYCECFARGQACDGCNCSNCMNNISFDDERNKAIKMTLDRNPLAFYPKIGSSERRHSKGCNCKRSNCLKNYCECYEAKISCSDLCRCQGCRNFTDFSKSCSLQPVAVKAINRSSLEKQQIEKSLKHIPKLLTRHDSVGLPIQKSQSIFNACVTSEVVEVACSCMISQLFEAEQQGHTSIVQEQAILSEFGRCLDHILDSVNKLRIFQNSSSDYHTAAMSTPIKPLPVIGQSSCEFIFTPQLQLCPNTQHMDGTFKQDFQLAHVNAYQQHQSATHEAAYNDKLFLASEPQNERISQRFESVTSARIPSCVESAKYPVLEPNVFKPTTMLEISDLSESLRAQPNEPRFPVPYHFLLSTVPETHPKNTYSFDPHLPGSTETSEEEADLATAALKAEENFISGISPTSSVSSSSSSTVPISNSNNENPHSSNNPIY